PACPFSTKRRHQGAMALALEINVRKSISWWAPQLRRSTSPGFGVISSSVRTARPAVSATRAMLAVLRGSMQIASIHQLPYGAQQRFHAVPARPAALECGSFAHQAAPRRITELLARQDARPGRDDVEVP